VRETPEKRRTGLPTPRPATVAVTGAGVSAHGRETQMHAAPRRGSAATSAIAKGQSAEGIVDEKSVGKTPLRRGRRRPERCMARMGHQKVAAKGKDGCCEPLPRMGNHVHSSKTPDARFATCSGRVADFTCLLAEYAIRTLGGVGGTPRKGRSYPVGPFL